ncbi:37S ribosomal protein S35, mitochondrial [Termitomyces sp. J132]|nr:37S ribosomal protein S35, mitochondrial [Termitomyces sp. J132]
MFSYLRLAPRCARTCHRPFLYHNLKCNNSFTRVTRREISELSPEPSSEEDIDGNVDTPDPLEEVVERSKKQEVGETRQPETYKEFMEAAGEKFRKSDRPNNWLGGGPFPMNPSFKPPPPVSDAIRTAIYQSYMADPIANDVRALSQKYHLSLKRIDAILRLKGMEADWVKGIPLQTGFRKGMEMILDVPQQTVESHARRSDAQEADMLEQDENRDAARQRYQQLYWESVPEDGREPIVPASLEHAKATAKRYVKMQEAYKSNPRLMPRVKDTTTQTPKEKVQIVVKPGRPSMKFVDVGGHFIEVHKRVKRIAESKRRAKEVKLRPARKEARETRRQAKEERRRLLKANRH